MAGRSLQAKADDDARAGTCGKNLGSSSAEMSCFAHILSSKTAQLHCGAGDPIFFFSKPHVDIFDLTLTDMLLSIHVRL